MRVPAVMTLGLLVAACTFNPSGQPPGVDDPPDASPGGEDGQMPPDDGPRPPDDGNLFVPPWWNPESRARLRLVIDQPPTTELLADVPVLVVLDEERVRYDRADGEGRDLRFVTEDGNELAHEIERWDPSGRSFVWVRVPEIAAGASTTFWMYYDHPEVQAPAGSVWTDDDLAVWHLAEDTTDGESGVTHRDATGRGNDGTQNGNDFVGADGQVIGGAQAFNNSEDYIEIPQGDLQETGTALTLLARVYVDDEPNALSVALGSGTDADIQWQLAWSNGANVWTGRIDTVGGRASSEAMDSTARQSWHLIALIYDGAQAQLYVDGEPVSAATPLTGNLEPLAGPLYIGNNPEEEASELDGLVDEVRIARVARSQSWLRVQHASMNDDLLGYGPTECLGGC
jgi:hypothetical protein